MIEFCIVENFRQHGFVGVTTFFVYRLECIIRFALSCKAVYLHVEVIDEEVGHHILLDELLDFEPVVFVELLLVSIRHEDKIADLVCKAQRHTSGVDSLKYLLCVVFCIELDSRANQLCNTIVHFFNGESFFLILFDQFAEELIVFPDTSAFIYLVIFVFHEESKLLIITLDRFELELAGGINAIFIELISIEQGIGKRFFFGIRLGVVKHCFHHQVDSGEALLTVNNDIVIYVMFFFEKGIYHRATEVGFIFLICLNDISKQFNALFL